MATTLEVSVDIERDIDAVFETMCKSDYLTAKLEAAGARNIEIQQSGADGARASLVYKREEPADVPGALKKFLSEWNELTNRDDWSGTPGESYNCRYEVDMSGPVSISGTHSLAPDGDGTTSTITMDISCKIPLIGKKLEQFVAELAKQGLQDDVAFQKKHMES